MTAAPTPVLASLEARVVEQPWRTVGGAFLLGAWVGSQRVPRNPLARAVFAMIGSIALRVMRESAFREIVERAARPTPER